MNATITVIQDKDDFIVTVVKQVAVPKAAVMSEADPARSLIDAVKQNLGPALDTAGYDDAKEQIELQVGGVYADIKKRFASESARGHNLGKDAPADGKERPAW